MTMFPFGNVPEVTRERKRKTERQIDRQTDTQREREDTGICRATREFP